jgi:hypothetical protein
LAAHVINIVVGPGGRWSLVFNGCVFGRHPKGIPTHGLQYVIPLHGHESTDDITDGVIPDMPHVQLARRIGEHAETVEFWLIRIFDRFECLF